MAQSTGPWGQGVDVSMIIPRPLSWAYFVSREPSSGRCADRFRLSVLVVFLHVLAVAFEDLLLQLNLAIEVVLFRLGGVVAAPSSSEAPRSHRSWPSDPSSWARTSSAGPPMSRCAFVAGENRLLHIDGGDFCRAGIDRRRRRGCSGPGRRRQGRRVVCLGKRRPRRTRIATAMEPTSLSFMGFGVTPWVLLLI